jgi:uncharacterized LabA/DUF88 family protein
MPTINRTVFLIDGFNVYHSVKNASRDLGLGGAGTRWLDISAFCRSYFSAIAPLTDNAPIQVEGIYYFSALATHLEATKSDVTKRHKTYIECLEATGITVELSRFKKKKIPCVHCGQNITRREEKETDVAIASKLLEVFHLDQCDTAMIVTGDTDIVPAFKTAQRLFPQKHIGFLLPYKRHNKELTLLTPLHFLVPKEAYIRHQFPNPFITPASKSILKPASW